MVEPNGETKKRTPAEVAYQEFLDHTPGGQTPPITLADAQRKVNEIIAEIGENDFVSNFAIKALTEDVLNRRARESGSPYTPRVINPPLREQARDALPTRPPSLIHRFRTRAVGLARRVGNLIIP